MILSVMLILIKYANRQYKFTFAIYPTHTHTFTHSLAHTYIYIYVHRENCRHTHTVECRHTYAGKAQMGDTCNPTSQLKGGLPPPLPLLYRSTTPLTVIMLRYYLVIYAADDKCNLLFALCNTGKWQWATSTATATAMAKNGCKDMIISNHLNNLLLCAPCTPGYTVKILA